MRRAILLTSAASLAAAMVAATIVATSSSPSPEQTTDLITARVDDCYQAPDADMLACVNSTYDALAEVVALPELVEGAVRFFGAHPEYGAACHDSMHHLGTKWSADVEKYFDAMQPYLPNCAYGLVHGMFENAHLPNDIDRAAQRIEEICALFESSVEGGSFKGRQLMIDCAHGVGHALAIVMPDDVESQVETCRRVFGDNETLMPECGAAAIMRYADELGAAILAGTYNPEVSPALFDELAKRCEPLGELADAVCAPSLSAVASSHSAEMSKVYLDWCQPASEGARYTCWAAISISMFGNPRTSSYTLPEVTNELLYICGVPYDFVSYGCWAEMAQGLMQRAIPRDVVAEQVCAEYRRVFPADIAEETCGRAQGVIDYIIDPQMS